MKATLNDIKKIIGEVLVEAKKKKEKAKGLKGNKIKPDAYEFDEAFDFSAPLGAYNLYASQGASNFGPYTGPGQRVDVNTELKESTDYESLRYFVRSVVSEHLSDRESAWRFLGESTEPSNVWEAAQHWYDFNGLGLGKVGSGQPMAEKKEKLAKKSKKRM